MKMLGLPFAIGVAILFGSSAGNAETFRMQTTADATELSSRHRCLCRTHRSTRVVGIYKHRCYRSSYCYRSNYPHAPWRSVDYFPRYYLYYPGPIRILYRE